MFEHYYPELHRFFTRLLRSSDVAADIVQESYARVLALDSRTQPVGEPRALLYRIGKNLAIDQARQQKSEDRLLARLALADLVDTHSPERNAIACQRLQRLQRRLRRLPRKRREAFILVRVHGYSHADVAGRLGISIAAVEKHVVRAVIDLAGLAQEP